MPRRLKVFRTAAGFHDAYVAAPSRAAALRAWGAERDLFARGIAEEVTDAALTAEPLAHPGAVVRRSRGSAAEHLAAVPAKSAPRAGREPPIAEAKRRPKPDRDQLVAAETSLATAQAAVARVGRDFDAQEAALARSRRAAERAAKDAVRDAERAHERVAASYARALAEWEG